MFECMGCEQNCHVENIPWWGNKCLAKKVDGECFIEHQGAKINMNRGYQPNKTLNSNNPPCGGSGVPNKKSVNMNQKWEYLIRPLPYTVEELNKLGQDGWEMCGIEYFEKHDSEIFYFKRVRNDSICPHCEFLERTFCNHSETTDREYWLMTEVFAYLHGSDVCTGGDILDTAGLIKRR